MLQQLYDRDQRVRQELLEWVPCNLCGSSTQRPWGAKDGWSIVQCAECALVYVNPRLNARGMALAYAEEYFALQYDPEDTRKRLAMYRIEIADLERTVRGGRILDVGAGRGDFLAALGSHWQKHGCEVNAVAVEYARTHYGLGLQQGEFRSVSYEGNRFDCVSLRGVIEHLPDPLGDLREAFRVLRAGGILSLNTPNIDSFCARVYREGFRLVDPRFHIYYFSPRTLTRLLEATGFRVLREAYFYLDTPYADPVNDVRQIAEYLIRKQEDPSSQGQSPAFFDNVMNVYAMKP